MRRVAWLVVVSLLLACRLVAQSPNGTISGIVHDPSGAVIPDVQVIIVNDATGVPHTTQTNGEGIYVVPSLPPGRYRIQVAKIGFKTLIKPDIVLSVQDAVAINFILPVGAASETVTVPGGAPLVNTQSAAVSTVINREFIESLPLNGRSFNTLLQLTPGVVIAPTNGFSPGQFSIGGQRTDANNFTIDGVSANFGVGPTLGLGGSGTGTAQAFSALGGTSSLVSVETLQEFRIETSSFAPEFGRSPGGQVLLTTRSGSNDFHGGVSDYFRNTEMDANDWFANEAALARAPEHHNDFGGYLGGPIVRDRTFFFVSYEGARLDLPQTQPMEVPSSYARAQAAAFVAPFLDAYPQPNGQPASPTAFTAPFTGSFSNTARLDAGSVRVDHTVNSRFSLFGRYNDAPSSVSSGGFNPQTTTVNTETLTLGVNMQLSKSIVNTLRGNYSTQRAGVSSALDSFAGAVPLDPAQLLGTLPAASTYLEFGTLDTTNYAIGTDAENHTAQLNLVDDLSWTLGAHQLKFGEDYRAIRLDKEPFAHEVLDSATSVQGFISTAQVSLTAATAAEAKLLSEALSLYAQDSWKISPRLALTYGLRWELDPAPSPRGSTKLAAWANVNNPADLALAPAGTPLWNTTYGNFAPRAGIAYSLTGTGDLVLRAGGGVFYDLGVGQAAQLGSSFPNFLFGTPATVSLPLASATPYLPSLGLAPPYAGVEAYSPNLELPRSYQWNVALEKSLGKRQAVSATYVGQAGRELLREAALFEPNANFTGDFLLQENDARSNYNALEVQFRRPFSGRLQGLLNYTWSHSLDDASGDVVAGFSDTVIPAARDYSPSDFNVGQSLSGALTYAIPGPTRGLLSVLASHWSLDSVIVARTGFPFNAFIVGFSPDPGGEVLTRPDLVAGQPLWINNPLAPGGQSLNPNAFAIPSTVRQGTEGRNDIGGFGLTEMDVSLGRVFPVTERVGAHLRLDAFNVFNHPNFTNPLGFVQFGSFYLQSEQMLNQGLGGLNPLFQQGGPRSLQVSLQLTF